MHMNKLKKIGEKRALINSKHPHEKGEGGGMFSKTNSRQVNSSIYNWVRLAKWKLIREVHIYLGILYALQA